MGSAGGCFETREGVDIAGALSAISQLHCRIGQKSTPHSSETWTDPEELSQRRVIRFAWFAFDIFLPRFPSVR